MYRNNELNCDTSPWGFGKMTLRIRDTENTKVDQGHYRSLFSNMSIPTHSLKINMQAHPHKSFLCLWAAFLAAAVLLNAHLVGVMAAPPWWVNSLLRHMLICMIQRSPCHFCSTCCQLMFRPWIMALHVHLQPSINIYSYFNYNGRTKAIRTNCTLLCCHKSDIMPLISRQLLWIYSSIGEIRILFNMS